MQTIVHTKDYTFIHPIFNEFERLYTALSNNDKPKTDALLAENPFDSSLKAFEDIFNEYGNCQTSLTYKSKKYKKLDTVIPENKNVIVTFSGGKDSTAVALHYRDAGYNVYLYHVHGLNKLFPKEQESAEAIASYLNMPLAVENVSLSGVSLYPDHPLKNIIIANMALQWGIRNGVGTFVTAGDYSTAYLDDVCFETAGDDAVEMWNTWKPIMERIIPDFKFELALTNVQDTLDSVGKDKKLLELAQSCVMTHRYKEYLHKRAEEKYRIRLMPHRCGSCWKCCLEYIYYTDKDVLDYNEAFYKHCLDVLKKTINQEEDRKHTDDEVWSHFFFYDKSESKYYGNLLLT